MIDSTDVNAIATKNWLVIERADGSLDVIAKIDNAFDIRVGEYGAHRPRRARVYLPGGTISDGKTTDRPWPVDSPHHAPIGG